MGTSSFFMGDVVQNGQLFSRLLLGGWVIHLSGWFSTYIIWISGVACNYVARLPKKSVLCQLGGLRGQHECVRCRFWSLAISRLQLPEERANGDSVGATVRVSKWHERVKTDGFLFELHGIKTWKPYPFFLGNRVFTWVSGFGQDPFRLESFHATWRTC